MYLFVSLTIPPACMLSGTQLQYFGGNKIEKIKV